MADIALSSSTHDIVLTNTTLGLVYDADYRAQRIKIALKHRMGEWWKDESQGTDLDEIFGKTTELTRRAELRRRCLQVPGIAEITSIRTELDRVRRHWTAEIELLQDNGEPLDLVFTGRA